MGTRAVVATAAALGLCWRTESATRFALRLRRVRAAIAPKRRGCAARFCRQSSAAVRAASRRLPGLRAHDKRFFPSFGGGDRRRYRARNARLARPLCGRGKPDHRVMGCVVNGPGESKMADIGVSLPGAGENPVAPVFVDGHKVAALKGDAIAADFKRMLGEYIETRFAPK